MVFLSPRFITLWAFCSVSVVYSQPPLARRAIALPNLPVGPAGGPSASQSLDLTLPAGSKGLRVNLSDITNPLSGDNPVGTHDQTSGQDTTILSTQSFGPLLTNIPSESTSSDDGDGDSDSSTGTESGLLSSGGSIEVRALGQDIATPADVILTRRDTTTDSLVNAVQNAGSLVPVHAIRELHYLKKVRFIQRQPAAYSEDSEDDGSDSAPHWTTKVRRQDDDAEEGADSDDDDSEYLDRRSPTAMTWDDSTRDIRTRRSGVKRRLAKHQEDYEDLPDIDFAGDDLYSDLSRRSLPGGRYYSKRQDATAVSDIHQNINDGESTVDDALGTNGTTSRLIRTRP